MWKSKIQTLKSAAKSCSGKAAGSPALHGPRYTPHGACASLGLCQPLPALKVPSQDGAVSALPAVTRISAGNQRSLRANTQTASLGSTAPPQQDTWLPSRERQLLISTSILPPFPGSRVVEIFLSPLPQKAILVQRLLNPSAFPREALKHKIRFRLGSLPLFFLSR